MRHIHITSLGDTRVVGDIVERFRLAISALGYPTSYANAAVNPESINIVFFAQNLTPEQTAHLGKNAILVNLEHLHAESPWATSTYFDLLRQHYVWDYSFKNVKQLAQHNISNVDVIRFGHIESYPVGTDVVEQDIDVLFYGSLSPRRQAVIAELEARGLRVVHNGIETWTAEHRDSLLPRAKVVLNMHYFENSRNVEAVRLVHALSHQKAIVCELYEDSDIDPALRNTVQGSSYQTLAQTCTELVHDAVRRQALIASSQAVFQSISQAEILRNALNRYLLWLAQPSTAPLPTPLLWDTQRTIPKILHRVWIGPKPIPDIYERYWEGWRRMHPDWEMKTWRDADVAHFSTAHKIREAHTYAGKADIARYEVVYREGGFYVDADMECLIPLDPLTPYPFVIGQQPTQFNADSTLNNAFYGSVPGNEVLQTTLADLLDVDVSTGDAGLVTGPAHYRRAYDRHTDYPVFFDWDDEHFTFSEPSSFLLFRDNESKYLIHHFGASWQPFEWHLERIQLYLTHDYLQSALESCEACAAAHPERTEIEALRTIIHRRIIELKQYWQAALPIIEAQLNPLVEQYHWWLRPEFSPAKWLGFLAEKYSSLNFYAFLGNPNATRTKIFRQIMRYNLSGNLQAISPTGDLALPHYRYNEGCQGIPFANSASFAAEIPNLDVVFVDDMAAQAWLATQQLPNCKFLFVESLTEEQLAIATQLCEQANMICARHPTTSEFWAIERQLYLAWLETLHVYHFYLFGNIFPIERGEKIRLN